MKRILLTNDDGFFAEGLASLRSKLSPIWDVVVVAPAREQSAASHSLTLHRRLKVNKMGESLFSVEGTPTDCVILAVNQLLDEKPDLLVSGINHGPNLGDDVTYSGTVAAAMEGTLLGIPSVAISVACLPSQGRERDFYFDYAAEFASQLAEKIFLNGMPKDSFLNVNIPNLQPEQIRGVRITRLGRRIYQDPVFVKKSRLWGRPYYRIGGGDSRWIGEKDADFAAVEEGMVSICPLHIDLTDYRALSELQSWGINS